MNQDGISLVGMKEMAQFLDVPISWLYSRTRTGEVPHYRLGKYVKFIESEVMAWLQSKQRDFNGTVENENRDQ